MKQLIIVITLLVVTLPQLSFAEEEVIWETEKIGGLNEVQVSPLGEVLYNTNDSIIEVRSIDDGRVVDAIIFPNTTRLDQISISTDGRFMAVSGQTKYTIIYDLFERREVKRITTIAYEREEYGNNVVYDATRWISSSISPDGTKFTGIATARNGEMTNFVVIDISTEKVLYEQRRIIYDHFNPEKPYQKWQSTEYSPDGKYIVNQLEFKSGSDSVYIFDANTFEIYDVVLNTYSKSKIKLTFSPYKPMFAFYKSSNIYIYDIVNKRIINTDLKANSTSLVFSRNSNQLIYKFDSENHIYNIDSREIIYEYDFVTVPKCITLDNNRLISRIYGVIYCLNTYWVKSSVKNIENEIIISPNPTNGLVNISFTNLHPSAFKYEVISNLGQVVQSARLGYLQLEANSVNLDISTIGNGKYIIRVFSDREEFVFNVIKSE